MRTTQEIAARVRGKFTVVNKMGTQPIPISTSGDRITLPAYIVEYLLDRDEKFSIYEELHYEEMEEDDEFGG